MIEVKTNLPEFREQMAKAGRDFIPIAAAATRAAARVIANAVKRMAPRRTGRLRSAVIVKKARRTPRGEQHYIVGIRQGKGAQNVRRQRGGKAVSVNLDAFYWRFLEQGWTPRQQKNGDVRRRRGKTSGKVSHPFIEPAFRGSSGQALSAFYAALNKGFDKLNAR